MAVYGEAGFFDFNDDGHLDDFERAMFFEEEMREMNLILHRQNEELDDFDIDCDDFENDMSHGI